MTGILYRTAEVEADGRTLLGIAVPFGRASWVRDGGGKPYREAFGASAFTKTIQDRGDRPWPLMLMHQRTAAPLGAVRFRVTPTALEFEARVSDTVAGTEALALVADGALTDVSVAFRPMRDRQLTDADGPFLERTEAGLTELSLAATGLGQHEGAEVLAVRAAIAGTPRLDALRRKRALLFIP